MKVYDKQKNIQWILIAKGIGIILVVMGHFYPETSPSYWRELKQIIYLFHMPLFFLLSGYLYRHGNISYRDLIINKSKRLLYPFISIGSIFIIIKYAAGKVVTLDHPVMIDSIYTLIVDPIHSYMPLLWFIHALFLIFAFYPLAKLCFNNITILLLLVSVNSIFGSDYIIIGNSLANMPYFVTGIILREHNRLSQTTISNSWKFVIIFFLLFSTIYSLKGYSAFSKLLSTYPTQFFWGVVGSLLVITISHVLFFLSGNTIRNILMLIGYHSMTIYLFHTLFESMIRIALLQVFTNKWMPFELVASIAIISGIFFPFLLEKELLRKNRITNKFILGLA